MDNSNAEKLCEVCGFNPSFEDGMCKKCKGVFGSKENVAPELVRFANQVTALVSESPVDPTDWRARALKAEKALRTIDTITSMRVSKYLKSSAFLVQHLSFEQWQSIKIDEALDTCADVIRSDKGVDYVG